uniref:SWIM-type domain-containing protein n=1 Tax=Cannabis sativa TaxID=3483 RepID=A0A803Q831_CANSA
MVVHNLGQNEGQNDNNFGLDQARYETLIDQVADEAQEDSDFVEDEYALDEDDVGEVEVNTTEPSIWWVSVNDFCNQQEEDNSSIGYDDDEDLHSLKSGDEGDCGSKKSRKEFSPQDEWVQKRDNTTFRINPIWNVHNCGVVFNSRHVDATWLAKHFIDQLRMNPNMHYSNFMKLTTDSKFSHTTRHVFYNAKKKAKQFLQGSVAEQYVVLEDYCKQLLELNPGSTIIIKSNLVDEKRLFERVYVCLKACKDGFKACRPLIGLDGCFLKGYCKGMLLVAIGIDADNSMFPIAYAICEKENTDTWTWFLNLLKEDLEVTNPTNITMISDRQKGLENAQGSTFEGAEIRFCVRHLHANFKKDFPGLLLKQKLWACARATTLEEFKRKMAELKEANEKAYDWLMKKNPSEWSKSHFKFNVKCDMLLNNLCECFNAAILEAREKPIITMLEKIRFWLMSRFCMKRESVSKWRYIVGKRGWKVIEKNKQVARRCSCTRADAHLFQVHYHDLERFSVNLVSRTCTCRGYQLTGIPCGHAICAIWSFNLEVMDFVDNVYKKEVFTAQYASITYPMPSPDKWPNPGQNPIYPPANTVLPGRPKKVRKKDVDELPAANATKARRFGQFNSCSKCGKQGHSRHTCKNPTREHANTENQQATSTSKRQGRPPKKNLSAETVKRNKRREKKKARKTAEQSQEIPRTSQQG